jgi:hypothetical protein
MGSCVNCVAMDALIGFATASAAWASALVLFDPAANTPKVCALKGNWHTNLVEVLQLTCPNEETAGRHANETKSNSVLTFTNSLLRNQRT